MSTWVAAAAGPFAAGVFRNTRRGWLLLSFCVLACGGGDPGSRSGIPGDADAVDARARKKCTYTYSAGPCQPSGDQALTVVSSTPPGCTGTPLTSQSCIYTPPADGSGSGSAGGTSSGTGTLAAASTFPGVLPFTLR